MKMQSKKQNFKYIM